MKTSFIILIFALIAINSFAQEPAVNDTLIPIQHKRDTVQYEPKLEGGALIDTINTSDKKFISRPVRPATTPKKPSQKKDSVETKLGIEPNVPGQQEKQ
ncbi:MAG: hypothetical protein ABI763_03775 [Bacteroidota bacterium]